MYYIRLIILCDRILTIISYIGKNPVFVVATKTDLLPKRNWFDCGLFSILYMFKPSRRPMFKPPSLGPP